MNGKKLPMTIFYKEQKKARLILLLLCVLLSILFVSLVLLYAGIVKKEIKVQPVKPTKNIVVKNLVPQANIKTTQPTVKKVWLPVLPVEGKISTHFGWRKTSGKGFEQWNYLSGFELTFPGVQEIKAILPGKVELVEKSTASGYTIIITHADNLQSIYSFCTKIRVQPGETIASAQSIAQCREKLQFRLLKNGQPLNPEDYFNNYHL